MCVNLTENNPPLFSFRPFSEQIFLLHGKNQPLPRSWSSKEAGASCIYCTHTLCDYRGHKSVNQSTQWPNSSSVCLEVKGFIPVCGILKCVSLIFISEKYFVNSLFPLQRPTSNKTSFIEEKTPFSKGFFCTFAGSSKPCFSLIFPSSDFI